MTHIVILGTFRQSLLWLTQNQLINKVNFMCQILCYIRSHNHWGHHISSYSQLHRFLWENLRWHFGILPIIIKVGENPISNMTQEQKQINRTCGSSWGHLHQHYLLQSSAGKHLKVQCPFWKTQNDLISQYLHPGKENNFLSRVYRILCCFIIGNQCHTQ